MVYGDLESEGKIRRTLWKSWEKEIGEREREKENEGKEMDLM